MKFLALSLLALVPMIQAGNTSRSYVTAIGISESRSCPSEFSLAPVYDGLNGDLNQSAGGNDIWLCVTKNPIFGEPITQLRLQQNGNCPGGWRRAGQKDNLNGDLNQSAGGKDIFLCYTTSTGQGRAIKDVQIVSRNPATSQRPQLIGLNGDINQSAGGKDIFFKLVR